MLIRDVDSSPNWICDSPVLIVTWCWPVVGCKMRDVDVQADLFFHSFLTKFNNNTQPDKS